MELCDYCKKTLCEKNMELIKEDIVTIRCIDYEKNPDKIQGYNKPLYHIKI